MTEAYRTDHITWLNGVSANVSIPVSNNPTLTVDIPGSNVAVVPSILTTIVTYTNSAATPLFIDGWIGTGQYEGDWFFVVDSVIRPEDRSSASSMKAGTQFTTPRRLEPGSIIDIKVEHYGAATGQFAATIFGHR